MENNLTQMRAIEQYFHVALFIMLINMTQALMLIKINVDYYSSELNSTAIVCDHSYKTFKAVLPMLLLIKQYALVLTFSRSMTPNGWQILRHVQVWLESQDIDFVYLSHGVI